MADVTATRTRSLPQIRIEHLWVLLALMTIGAFISLRPTLPNDFWWHLKAGELIATEGIPTTNRFAWTLPADHPYVYQSWLGEYLFYLLYQLGGLPLTVFARNLLGTLAFSLVALETHRRTGSWRWAAAATIFAAAMTMNNFTTRTQNWSWVPFMLLFFGLSRYAEGKLAPRWLIFMPLLMIFWVNAHGAFVMGILVAGAFAVGETLRRLFKQPRALSWGRLRALYAGCIALVAATVVNPLGIGVFGYLQSMLGDTASQTFIIEWQTPDPRDLVGAIFYIGVLAVIAGFAFQRRRPNITEVLLVCGLAWQAFIGVRYVVWFGMVAMPILAQTLATPRPVFVSSAAVSAISPRERGLGAAANWIAASVMVAVLVLVQPWTLYRLPWPEELRAQYVDLPGAQMLFSATTPVSAVAYLREEPCAGPIFNEMGYGSYMAWALYPAAQSFIDPRVELFPVALWEDYIELNAGRTVGELLDTYGIQCVVLDAPTQPQLAAQMQTLPGWTQSFADGQSEVWRRQ